MIDVHPPHSPTHTWTDFFIHIATICVGLLIAIGLEQSVEALHRHHERTELLEALNHESEQIIHDANACAARGSTELVWFRQASEQLRSNLVGHTPFTGLTSVAYPHADTPDDPIYKAARASGKLALLSDHEIAAYGELDMVLEDLRKHIDRLHSAVSDQTDSYRVVNLSRSTGGSPSGSTDGYKGAPAAYTGVADEDLRRLYVAVGRTAAVQHDIYYGNLAASAAASALLKGERDLHAIQLAERSPVSAQ